MSAVLLDVQDLRGGYGRVEVLRGVSLQVRAGEIVALLGSNGAGKSTLNNTVCALVPAWSGRVVFDGADLTNRHYREVVREIASGGITVLMIEHVMQAVMNLAQQVWVLAQGQLIAHGTPREVTRDERVIEAYLGHGAAARLRAAEVNV